ncbi:MAG TPA: 50S ribosomal protein L9 [Pelomicrobium sp.]|nr:50S ribosomal protein L9 [Pelomicrobium sp.]
MQVILMEKVVNLGKLGDVVKVKNGYARNYLIPSGKARRATPENLAEFEARRAELERVQADALAAAQAQAAQLEGLRLEAAQKAGLDGKLFGSVTNIDVRELLGAKGFDIPKAAIRMPHGPIKTTGEHPVEIVLHGDVEVVVTVAVTGEA